jgi:hypothetical protein
MSLQGLLQLQDNRTYQWTNKVNDYDILDQAIELLETPQLIWSNDFECIRHHLWAMLKDERKSLAPHEATLDLAKALIDGNEHG